MITVLLTEAFKSKGGIPRFNCFLLRALCGVCAEKQETVRVLSLNDVAGLASSFTVHTSALNGSFKFNGANCNKFSFIMDSLKACLSSDLLIIGHVALAPIGYMLKRMKSSLRYMVITHGIEAWDIRGGSWERPALEHADLILSVSQFTRDKLVAQGFRRERIELLHNAVDEEVFVPAVQPPHLLARYKLRPQQPLILMVGRLAAPERYKGYDAVLRALVRILDVWPDAKLMIVGTGDDRPRLEELRRDLGLDDHVIFTGYVPDEELPAHYNLCNVFVLPSKGEGFGIVFLEALACGKPVIAGNKDGARDALLDGRLGFLVDPDDEVAVAAAILKVLQGSPDGALVDGAYLRRTVLDHFSFACFKKRLGDILQLTNGYHHEA